jgi:hypothetical protein
MNPESTEFDREFQQVLELILAGKRDHPIVQRGRDRGDELRRQMRTKYGARNIAVELIRESRGESNELV